MRDRRSHLVRRRQDRRRRRTSRARPSPRAHHAGARARGRAGELKRASTCPIPTLRLPALTDKDRADLAFVAATPTWSPCRSSTPPRMFASCGRCSSIARRRAAGHRAQDRDAARLREPAGDAARSDEVAALRGHDRARRSGRRVRLRADGRGAGGDPLALRGGARAGHLGDAGARDTRQGRHAVARRGHRCGHGAPRRVRDAQQGALHRAGRPGLDDILRRMHGHQAKKRSMLRELQLVSSFRKGRAAGRASLLSRNHKGTETQLQS